MKVRTIVADDHEVVLEGLRHVLLSVGCEIIATAQNGEDVVLLSDQLKPDLIVLDISMPLLNGIEAARQIRKKNLPARIIFLSVHDDASYVREAFRVGANGYVLKRAAASQLHIAVNKVMKREYYVSPEILVNSVTELLPSTANSNFGSELTPRQREVLQLVAEGKTAKEIATLLKISIKTVEFHKSSIMDALGKHTTAELTRYAAEHKILSE